MKIVLLAIVTLISYLSFAQNMSVEYDVKYTDSSYKNLLILSDSTSIWKDIPNETPNNTESVSLTLLKKFPEQTIYLSDVLFNKMFYVKDSLHCMKWSLTQDTKTILGHKCNSAITTFRGRKYVAFFSADYPYSNGPWKFGGLTGLILEVHNDDYAYQFTASKINENLNEKIDTSIQKKHKFYSWSDFTTKFISTVNNAVKMIKTNSDNETNGYLKIDAPEIIYPKAQQGTGLEY